MDKNISTAVIPAAGYGTRLLPVTIAVPKAVLPLGTDPILLDILWEAYLAGVRRVIVITNWREEVIKTLLKGDKSVIIKWLRAKGREDLAKKIEKILPPIDIEFIHQKILNGLGGAILLAEKYVDDPFIVMLSDNLIIEGNKRGRLVKNMVKVFCKYSASTVLAVASVDLKDVKRFGVIGYSRVFRDSIGPVYQVSRIVEKPNPEDAPSNFAVVGRYIFDTSIFDYLKKLPKDMLELDETLAISRQINENKKVLAVSLGKYKWYDVGSVEGYFKAFLAYLINREGKERVLEWIRREIEY